MQTTPQLSRTYHNTAADEEVDQSQFDCDRADMVAGILNPLRGNRYAFRRACIYSNKACRRAGIPQTEPWPSTTGKAQPRTRCERRDAGVPMRTLSVPAAGGGVRTKCQLPAFAANTQQGAPSGPSAKSEAWLKSLHPRHSVARLAQSYKKHIGGCCGADYWNLLGKSTVDKIVDVTVQAEKEKATGLETATPVS